ncbi:MULTISPECIES: TonB-dependent receptor [unclassified Carboxylicivirga]|uniref:TonB-dependent receptor n=1 Tax=Carboxylicivirga TaxID=1628153 RepID=UPI003D346FE5
MKKKPNCLSFLKRGRQAVWRILNVSLLLLLFTQFQAGATNSLDKTKVSLSVSDAQLLEVLNLLEDQTNVSFFFQREQLDLNRLVTIAVEDVDLNEVLNILFEGQAVDYNQVSSNLVVLKPSQAASNSQEGQEVVEIKVSGKVTDDKGEPIPGVSIAIKETTLGTATDMDGRYTIKVPVNSVLVYSFIGMKPHEVRVTNQKVLDVVLQSGDVDIDEVVVVGFGKQRKTSVVSSLSSVKPGDITVPTRNLTNSLAGQVSGLIAVQRSGEPGYDNASFWIRGVSTFAGGTNPLVLVDGVPRNMNDIEPDEIETFSVLKDAAATAVYGAQGANGVVLITTKRGGVERAKITFRTEHSISTPTRLPEFVGSVDYMNLYNEAMTNDGESPLFSEELIDKYRNNEDPDLYPNTNWLDLMLKDHTSNHRYTLNVKGGTERARYFVSGAYYNESGLFQQNPTDKYDTSIGLNRYNLRSNIDLDVTRTTLVKVDLAGQYLENTFPGTGTPQIFRSMLITPPHVFPAYYSDGVIATYPQERDANMRNPWNLLMHSGYAKEWRTSMQSKVGVNQKLDFVTKGLSAKVNVSFDFDSNFYSRRTFNPSRYHADSRNEDGSLNYTQVVSGQPDLSNPNTSSSNTKHIYIEGAVNYSRTFDDMHKVGGMLLYHQRESQHANNALPFRKQGAVGRFTYGFSDRYFVEANFGFSGSETFAKGHRFGFFPSVGAAYYISNEPFYPEGLRKIISNMKLRYSYGITGNDNTGGERFLYRATFTTNGPGFSQGIGDNGGTNTIGNGIYENRFAAPYLSWEIETKQNVGVEMSFMNNKVNLMVDYFNSERRDILLQRRTVSQVGGFRSDPWQNYGIVKNHGIDASLDGKRSFGDFTVGVRSTFTFARNKIVEYDELEQPYPWMSVTGTRVNENTVYIADGLYTDNDFIIGTNPNGTNNYTLRDHLPQPTLGGMIGPGDIKYKDINGDGIIDAYDKVRGVGNPSVPEIVYGFGVSLQYKGFYANAFFQGVANTSVRLGGATPEGWYPFAWGVDQSNYRTFALDRWTPENPSQDVLMPRLHRNGSANANNQVPSTWWLKDGSFLRFKNLEVGYNFSKNDLRFLRLEHARLYVMGHNIALWDDIKHFDPESGNSNGGLNYPLARTFTVGLDITF